MKELPLRLPWTMDTVPHAALDILRGCNIRCRDCYNLRPDRIQSLAEIDAQLDALARLRKLQSVSIVGGEITLHPNLVEIVRRVRQRGLFAELFTNAVGLDESLLARLQQAGANVIFLHIEPKQRRPDLPSDATTKDLNRLRAEKAALIAGHAIEVGLAVTVYPDKPEELEEAVAFALQSPHICYLLVTWWRDVNRLPPIRGDLLHGMVSDAQSFVTLDLAPEGSPADLCRWIKARFLMTPFASVGSNQDPADTRWLSFLVVTSHQGDTFLAHHCLSATWMERNFLEASRRLTGRYPFYQAQRPGQLRLHLLLNGLAGGGFAANLRLLSSAARSGARLMAKRFLFQWPATLDKRGRVIHCQCCPDAVLKDGRLVPLCLSDRIVAGEAVGAEGTSTLTRA